MADEQQSARSWITDGMIIALITASAYFWALRYETGWYEYFKIPSQLISLNLTNVFDISGLINFVFANLLVPVLVLLWMWNPSNRFIHRFSSKYPTAWFFLSIMIPISLMLYITIINKELFPDGFWVIGLISVLFYAIFFIRAYITKRWKGSYWTRFKASLKLPPRPEPTDIHFSPSLINVLMILAVFGWAWFGTYHSYWGGKKSAESFKGGCHASDLW
jgi:hypothetical protein